MVFPLLQIPTIAPAAFGLARKEASQRYALRLSLRALKRRCVGSNNVYWGVTSVYFNNIVDQQHLDDRSLVNFFHALGENEGEHREVQECSAEFFLRVRLIKGDCRTTDFS